MSTTNWISRKEREPKKGDLPCWLNYPWQEPILITQPYQLPHPASACNYWMPGPKIEYPKRIIKL